MPVLASFGSLYAVGLHTFIYNQTPEVHLIDLWGLSSFIQITSLKCSCVV